MEIEYLTKGATGRILGRGLVTKKAMTDEMPILRKAIRG